MHRFVWCGCEEVKKVSANECVLFFCAHKKRIGCEKQFQRTLPMLKLSLTYALFLSAPTTCARARALLSHTMHLICTYSAVFYTNSIQTFSINSSRVCVSNDAKLSIACLLTIHPFSFVHSFGRYVYMHLLSTNHSCASFNTHLLEIYLKKRRRRWKRQRKKEIIETVARAAMIEWMSEWLDALFYYMSRLASEKETPNEIES